MTPNEQDTQAFHGALRRACDRFDPAYYERYKRWCDEYFYLPHRSEPRGVGGIFYDYLDSADRDRDFAFTRALGEAFLDIYPRIVRTHMDEPWTAEEREQQLRRRGRYGRIQSALRPRHQVRPDDRRQRRGDPHVAAAGGPLVGRRASSAANAAGSSNCANGRIAQIGPSNRR